MKLATYYVESELRLGVVVEGGVLDVRRAREQLGGIAPTDIHTVIAGGTDALEALWKLVSRAQGHPELFLHKGALTLAPCVPNPQKILCVGLNYRSHTSEMKMDLPTSPVLFSKFSNSLTGAGSDILLPEASEQVDYEAELAVVIGRRARNVAVEDALDYVFGYCNACDLSARDLQFRTSQWLLGKTPDQFLPIGPYVVTADEVADPANLTIRCWVNGERRQDSNTGNMIFSAAHLVSYISQYMTLEPGDLILTGTPEGVISGYPEAERSKLWLKDGDVVTVEVEGMGRLANRLVRSLS